MTFLDLDGLGRDDELDVGRAGDLPAGSTVLYARLVWGGRRDAGDGGSAAAGAISQVKFRAPGPGDVHDADGDDDGRPRPRRAPTAGPYQASIDVTTLVAGGRQRHVLGRRHPGRHRRRPLRRVVAGRRLPQPAASRCATWRSSRASPTSRRPRGNNSVTIPISGFLTPATGHRQRLGRVRDVGGRPRASPASRCGSTARCSPTPCGRATNFFNSGISDGGANVTARNANYPNNFGVDIARVVANGVLPNNATSTTSR